MERNPHVPTITILGRTGTGKSTILNDITGQNFFKAGIGSRSVTDDYIVKTLSIIGDEENKKIKFCDTIGFEDNRQVDSLFLTKTQKYLKSLADNIGVDLVIITVAVQNNIRDLYLDPVTNTIDLLGENVIPKILLVFTQVNYMIPELKDVFYKQFKKSEIVENLSTIRNIDLNESQIMIYEKSEDNKSLLISKINDIISIKKPVIPYHSKLIIESNIAEEVTKDGMNDAAIIYIGENKQENNQNWRINRYLQNYFRTQASKASDSNNILVKKVGEYNIPNVLGYFESRRNNPENNNNNNLNTSAVESVGETDFNPDRTSNTQGIELIIKIYKVDNERFN